MKIASAVNAKKFSPFGMSLYWISLELNKARATKHMSTDSDYERLESLKVAELNLWTTRLWLATFRRNQLG